MRYVPLIIFLGVCGLLLAQLMAPPPPAKTEGWPIGQKVPVVLLPVLTQKDDAAALLPMNALSHSSNERNGYVINFFASWCTPCLAEMPQLETLRSKHGILILGIAWKDDAKTLQKFFAEHGRPYVQVLMDTNGKAMTEMGATGVPETFVVDGNGVIIRRFRSNLQPSDIDTIADLLKQPSSAKKSAE